MPAPQGQTLPVQVESCNLRIVSLKVNEVEEVGGRLFLSLLSEKKGGIMPWTQTAAGSEETADKHDHREQKKAFSFSCTHRDCLSAVLRFSGPWGPWGAAEPSHWTLSVGLWHQDVSRLPKRFPGAGLLQTPQSSAGTRTKIL